MIDIMPSIQDGIEYYSFVPMLSTLYGRNEEPYRFLRVVDEHVLSGRSTQTYEENSTNFIIENVDIKTFLNFISYGYTPYIETVMTGFKSGLDLSNYTQFFMSQAVFRNYESRITSLIELAEKKKFSIAGATTSNSTTQELCDEIDGALMMWEMSMNLGDLKPTNCLPYIQKQNGSSLLIPIKRFKEKFNELDERLLMNQFVNTPFKITNDLREILISAFTEE